jgi:magnesium transporter
MGDHRTRVWRNGRLEKEDFPGSSVSDYLEDRDTVVWLDLHHPDAEQFKMISEELGLDPLAVEDALSSQERTKVDRYTGYLFLNVYSARLTDDGRLDTDNISAFVTERALVTLRQGDGFDVSELTGRWDSEKDLAKYGVAFLLHGLLDQVVDGHFDAVQALDGAVEGLEDLLFDDATPAGGPALQRRSYDVRKSLVMLRRVVLPMREVVNTLMRRDLHVVPTEMAPYFQDVYDHAYRAAEWTDSLRDLVTTVLDTRIALQGNRLNLVMKQVTSWAAIIAVPTAVTGFYGMNVPYPGYGTHWGFGTSVAVLVVTAVILYTVFKKRDWL